MRRRTIVIGAVVAAVIAGGTTTWAVASGSDDSEPSITGPALARASTAALEHTGGGRVTDTEVGDEESYYEVEVTRPDGSQVDVQLDRDFRVVSSEDDNDTTEDESDGEG